MALTRVQVAPGTSVGGNTSVASVTFTTTPIVGNAIVVPVIFWSAYSNALTCTDTQGNTYTLVVQSAANVGASVAIFSCNAITATGSPFTVTVHAPTTASYFTFTAVEVHDLTALDKTASSTGSSAAPTTGSTAPLGTPSDAIAFIACSVAANMASLTVQALTPPWLQEIQQLSFSSHAAGESDDRILYGVGGTTQSGNWTLAPSGTPAWSAAIAVFTGVAAPPPVQANRVTQLALEVLVPQTIPTRTTQTLVELVNLTPAASRVTQVLVELFVIPPGVTPPPCLTALPLPSVAGKSCTGGLIQASV